MVKFRAYAVKKAYIGRYKASFNKTLSFPIQPCDFGFLRVTTVSVGSRHAFSDLLEICTALLKKKTTLQVLLGTRPSVLPSSFFFFK